MVSCDNWDKSDEYNLVVGTWIATDVSQSGDYDEYTLTFETNGTGTIRVTEYNANDKEIGGEMFPFTYSMSSDHVGTLRIKNNVDGDRTMNFSIESESLYLYNTDGEYVRFTRKDEQSKDWNPLADTKWEFDDGRGNEENIWFYFTGEENGYITEKGHKSFFTYTFDSKANIVTVTESDGDVEQLEYHITYLWWESEWAMLVKDGIKKDDVSEGVYYNGHYYVDLGLSVKWATYNIGASKPEGYGDFFAWGETSAKSSYGWSNLRYCISGDMLKDNVEFSKYVTNDKYGSVDYKTTLEAIDDAANVNWGGRWRMPTASEIKELQMACSWIWITLNGVEGYKVYGKNGNSIFLPAAGVKFDSGWHEKGDLCFYWSSSLVKEECVYAYSLVLCPYEDAEIFTLRSYGQSVRPVCK